MENIDNAGHVIQILEYGKLVIQYHDENYERFMFMSEDIISKYLNKNKKYSGGKIKNFKIHIFTN